MNLLLEAVLDKSAYIWIGVIVVLFIAFYTLNLVRRRKYQEEVTNLLSNLRVGDKVKTYTGVFGTIVEIKEWANGNSVLLATGEGDRISYISVDLNAIYGIDNREEKKVEEKEENVEAKPEESAVSEEKADVAAAGAVLADNSTENTESETNSQEQVVEEQKEETTDNAVSEKIETEKAPKKAKKSKK